LQAVREECEFYLSSKKYKIYNGKYIKDIKGDYYLVEEASNTEAIGIVINAQSETNIYPE
jgi:hypothetical protein